jgi:hypothetical protein
MYVWNKQSPSNLGFYRPNQAMNRTYVGYPGLTGLGAPPVLSIATLKAVHPLHGLGRWKYAQNATLGDDTGISVQPNTLLVGVGLLAAGMFLLGGKHGPRLGKRKAARLRRRLASLEG